MSGRRLSARRADARCSRHGTKVTLMRVTILQDWTRTTWARSVRTAVGRSIIFVSLLIVTSGCQITQPAFVRVTGEAGAEFAAATTLQYAHEDQLTQPYARAAFESYASALEGADRQITSAEGAPNQELARRLADLSREAAAVVADPCFAASCDWRGQVMLLQRTSEVLREASGG